MDRLLTPPMKEAEGHVRLSSATALMKSTAYPAPSGAPIIITWQSKMMSSAGKSSFARSSL